jgi:RNA polymerase sigma factor (TIGR02999 family)
MSVWQGWFDFAGKNLSGGLYRYNAADMSDATRLIDAVNKGDPHAAAQLLPLVYQELRQLAQANMANERPSHTLQPTALVHEAYLRLVDVDHPQHWNGRGHFFAAAAEAMRRILVENARRKQRVKHGGEHQRVELDEMQLTAADDVASTVDVVALDEALTRLGSIDAPKAELVKLRFFAGLTLEDAAGVLDLSPATADRYWAFARAWLFRELSGR